MPILTRFFTTSEYGNLDMYLTIQSLIAMVVTMGLDSSQTFFFTEAKNKGEDTKFILHSISELRLIISVLFTIIFIPFGYFFNSNFFSEQQPFSNYLYILGITFLSMLISNNIEIFRLIYKPWKYNLYNIIQAISSIVITLVLILYFNYGIEGYLIGTLIGALITWVLLIPATKKFIISNSDFKSRIKLWKKMINYGAPLIIGALSFQIILSSDRWFIMKYLGSNELGIYAVATNISMAVALIVVAFRRAWLPHSMELQYDKNGNTKISKITNQFLLTSIIIIGGVCLFSKFFVSIFASIEFFDAWEIVGIYSLTHIWYGLLSITSLGILYSKKTFVISYICILTAIINLILNYYLIKQMGSWGTAFATNISLIINNLLFIIIGNKYFSVKWDWKIIISIIVLLFCIITYFRF